MTLDKSPEGGTIGRDFSKKYTTRGIGSMDFLQQPGGYTSIPDLITFLQDRFQVEVKKLPPGVGSGAEEFCTWAKEYLSRNRPTEVFAVDRNQGLLLTNGYRVVVSPYDKTSSALPGGMANPDTSVKII
jgi:hypothetical protein